MAENGQKFLNISDHVEPFWPVLDRFKVSKRIYNLWIISDRFGPFQTVLDHLDCFGPFLIVQFRANSDSFKPYCNPILAYSKLSKTVQNGPKWLKMVLWVVQRWSQRALNGLKWLGVVP
jgi:hypothetical protein